MFNDLTNLLVKVAADLFIMSPHEYFVSELQYTQKETNVTTRQITETDRWCTANWKHNKTENTHLRLEVCLQQDVAEGFAAARGECLHSYWSAIYCQSSETNTEKKIFSVSVRFLKRSMWWKSLNSKLLCEKWKRNFIFFFFFPLKKIECVVEIVKSCHIIFCDWKSTLML